MRTCPTFNLEISGESDSLFYSLTVKDGEYELSDWRIHVDYDGDDPNHYPSKESYSLTEYHLHKQEHYQSNSNHNQG